MARRRNQRTSPIEDIVMLASRLPWWGCLLLAIVSYGVLHAIASRPLMPKTLTPGQMGDAVVSGMFTTMATFGQFILPGAFAIAAIVSAINGHPKKKGPVFVTNDVDAAPRLRKRSSVDLTVTMPHQAPGHTEQNFQHELLQPLATPSAETPQAKRMPQQWSESVLQMIEWKRFEIVTKEFLSLTGHEAHETNVGADGGVDIRVTKRGNDSFRGIVQCKAWNAYRVGVKPVRELYGVMAAEKASHAMLITSGTFTNEAEEFAKGKLMLVSGRKFIELIRNLAVEKQQRLLEIALEGDYSTPTCPQCDIKMTLRPSTKGYNSSGKFWGCVRYPRCRQKLAFSPKGG